MEKLLLVPLPSRVGLAMSASERRAVSRYRLVDLESVAGVGNVCGRRAGGNRSSLHRNLNGRAGFGVAPYCPGIVMRHRRVRHRRLQYDEFGMDVFDIGRTF